MARRSRNDHPEPREYRPGKWRLAVELPAGPDGQRERHWIYADSYAECEAKWLDARRLRDRGLLSGTRTPLGAWLDHWLRTSVTQPGNTYRAYRTMIERHIKPAIGHIPLNRLTVADVQGMLDQASANAGAPTARTCRAALGAALRIAERRELVFRNVARIAEPVAVAKPVQRPYTLAEALRLRTAIAGDDYEALYLLLLTTGLRHGEALGLTWPDIDWEAGEIAVASQLQPVAGQGLRRVPVKTAASAEVVAMTPTLAATLRAHQARQTITHPWRLVFLRPSGQPIDNRWSNRRWNKLLADHGLPHVRIHDLRHTVGTLLYGAGVHPKDIQSTLRHASIRTTMDTYVHGNRAGQRRAAETIETLLRKPGE